MDCHQNAGSLNVVRLTPSLPKCRIVPRPCKWRLAVWVLGRTWDTMPTEPTSKKLRASPRRSSKSLVAERPRVQLLHNLSRIWPFLEIIFCLAQSLFSKPLWHSSKRHPQFLCVVTLSPTSISVPPKNPVEYDNLKRRYGSKAYINSTHRIQQSKSKTTVLDSMIRN